MKNIKKTAWIALGFVLLGVAYIGIVTPGIPWSTPTVGAAFCFARGSERWHHWIMNHRWFGPFLVNWSEKRIFPTRAKWAMILTMDSSLIILWFTTHNWQLVASTAVVMVLVAAWALRYPGSQKEWEKRQRRSKYSPYFNRNIVRLGSSKKSK